MKSLTDFALKNSRTIILMQFLIVFVGLIIFPTFPKLEDPAITIREAVVTAYFPGMSPDRIERLITRPIEEQIRTMGMVDNIEVESCKIKSTSKFGSSLIHFVVKDTLPASELPTVWKNLRNKMSDIKSKLPKGTIGPFVNDEFGDTAMATVALLGEGYSMAEMREVARSTREQLINVPGILKVDLYGVQDERIYLNFSNSKLAQLGLSTSTIKDALQEQNIILPSGKLNIKNREFIVEPTGKFKSIEQIGELLITLPDTHKKTNGTIALRDIATIRKGYIDPPFQPVYYNGKPTIILSVCLLPGVDAVGAGVRLKKRLKAIENHLPWGLSFEYATYQPDLITKAVGSMVLNVITSLIIVLVVIIILLGFRTGMIVGSFIPLVMLTGVVVMKIMGIEMQRMSLAAMIIALGMLVDNGICVAEEITTRMQMGASRRDAVLEAGRLLSIPLLVSTLTTVFAFMPMMLQSGGAGDYTRSLGSVITILLLASWALSMLSTTSACNWFMKVKPLEKDPNGNAPDPYTGKYYQFYKSCLIWMLGHRSIVIMFVIGILGLALFGFSFTNKTFFPPGDRNQYLMYLDYPAGTRVEGTDASVRKICKWLQNKKINPEITSNVAYVGSGGPRFFLSLAPDDPDDNYAFIIVNTETTEQVSKLVDRTRQFLLAQVPEVRGRIKGMWLGSTETGLFEMRLSGPDKELLLDQAETLEAALRDIPGMIDIKQDWNNRITRIKVDVDQIQARRAGLTTQEVSDSMNVFISGNQISDFYFGYADIPIIARGLQSERNSLNNLSTMGIYAKSVNKNVPLIQIANVYAKGECDRIKRYNQNYTVTINAKHQTMSAGEIFKALKPAIDKLKFPPRHFWHLGAELEESIKSQKRLAKWFPICFLVIIILLVWQFNSFRRATIIIMTMPLVLVGAVIGMLVMHADFGFMVILGLLSLAGSIVNNGIVLIDRIETYRDAGIDTYDAIIKSCINRVRPIFLSVSTTALGILTLIWPYNPLFYGMACVIIFGLCIGTVFTLGFVPVLYSVFFNAKPSK
jgi:multidrug efflux pump subunit AcrB